MIEWIRPKGASPGIDTYGSCLYFPPEEIVVFSDGRLPTSVGETEEGLFLRQYVARDTYQKYYSEDSLDHSNSSTGCCTLM